MGRLESPVPHFELVVALEKYVYDRYLIVLHLLTPTRDLTG
ncbi:hypothetical protein [Methylobacterium sp. E-065]|nr:hypothetical protein [Methylobacterium sp. E-065]